MYKKLLALLTVLTLILPVAVGFAEAGGDGLPAVGTTVHGFTVQSHYALDEVDAQCAYMVHDKTGARLTYVACEDTDRAFDITFRTPAKDDKGIPHVFEHATLCGSEKYPDPSLFFSMMYQTYNTFLNAMTFQNCTTFPASSLSEDQLYVYADYVLSGVFNPLIMTDERAMMREAYRYELADAESDITLNGTVYSEMQGALTMAGRAGVNLKKLLYPGSISSNISGGDPAVIPEMTHQELKDFHDSYYHPSNCMIVLYGKLDYEKFLKLIDEEYLSKYDYREIALHDDNYIPFEGFREELYTFPVAADANAQPITIYGVSLQNATTEDKMLMSIIANAFSKESSPLMTRCREQLPEATVAVTLDELTADTTFMVLALNVGEADKDTFKAIAEEAIAETLAEGLDMAVVESLCRRQHYADVIGKGQSGMGVNAATSIGGNWGMTEDPFCYKKQADIKANLMAYVKSGAFDETFRRLFANPVRTALAVTVPDAGGLERQSAALAQELAEKKAAMTDEEIDALVARTADFAAWTQGNQENSMIDAVKAVSVQTLPEEIISYTAEDRVIDGMRVVSSDVALDDVISVSLYLDASSIPFDQLHDYSLWATLLQSMPTKSHGEEALADAVADAAYSLYTTSSTIKYKDGGYHPVFNVSWTTTQDKLDDSFALAEEILYDTDFSDADLIRRILRENLLNNKLMAAMMPDILLQGYGMPLIDDDNLYGDYLSGDDFARYQQKIVDMTDEEMADLAQRLYAVRDHLLGKQGFILTCVGTEASIEQTVARTGAFYDKLHDDTYEAVDYAALLPRSEAPLACVIDGTMQFNMMIASMKDSGFAESGKMLAMNKLVNDRVLLQVIRFQNSAYGARASLDENVVYVSSYRDPNLSKTYEVFEELGDRIRALPLTQDDLDGYITGSYSTLASPTGALAGGTQAVSDALTGETTFDNLLRYMREIKQFSVEDVAEYAAIYDMLAEKGVKVTVGGAEAIEQNKDMFKTVITTYVE